MCITPICKNPSGSSTLLYVGPLQIAPNYSSALAAKMAMQEQRWRCPNQSSWNVFHPCIKQLRLLMMSITVPFSLCLHIQNVLGNLVRLQGAFRRFLQSTTPHQRKRRGNLLIQVITPKKDSISHLTIFCLLCLHTHQITASIFVDTISVSRCPRLYP